MTRSFIFDIPLIFFRVYEPVYRLNYSAAVAARIDLPRPGAEELGHLLLSFHDIEHHPFKFHRYAGGFHLHWRNLEMEGRAGRASEELGAHIISAEFGGHMIQLNAGELGQFYARFLRDRENQGPGDRVVSVSLGDRENRHAINRRLLFGRDKLGAGSLRLSREDNRG